MPNFSGSLRQNEVFSSIYNMIISQTVFADNIGSTNSKLSNMIKIDGGLYGDTKLFYATDALESRPWDGTDTNVLETARPDDPKCQVVTVDIFRQIPLTLDQYLSKRAFADEGTFSQFNSVMSGWIGTTKKIYDDTLINSHVGTRIKYDNQLKEITLPEEGTTNVEKEASNRLQAEMICKQVADILSELGDPSRDYNTYGFMRSYDRKDLVIVWNKEWANRIKFYANPSLYHELFLDSDVELPAKYFGTQNGNGGTTPSDNKTIRALTECVINGKHYFPGELIANSTKYESSGQTYTQKGEYICKIMHKNSMVYMSGFETGTSFFNPKSLSENQYLTWGHSYPALLDDKPFITVKKK